MSTRWILGIVVAMMFNPLWAKPLQSLDQLTWSNRLILVFCNGNNCDQHQSHLQQVDVEIEDRHIVWFLVTDEAVRSNYRGHVSPSLHTQLNQQWLSTKQSRPQVILIGKDGGSKLRANELDLNEIFAVIDQMPMRRYEMMNPSG